MDDKKEELTKEELEILADLLANANVKVSHAESAIKLFEKLQRMISTK